MRELGIVLVGCAIFMLFFVGVIYPNVEYKNIPSNSTCTGQCYTDYVKENGTVVEILQAKQALAAGDPFSDIRSLWSGCAACHGRNGEGSGMFPQLAGNSASYISGQLIKYKNREKIGMNSSMMWGQAGNLSDKEIELIGEFVAANLPSK
jgi:cytochrome c553